MEFMRDGVKEKCRGMFLMELFLIGPFHFVIILIYISWIFFFISILSFFHFKLFFLFDVLTISFFFTLQ